MLQFAITNLRLDETAFEIPSAVGKWEFDRASNYNHLLPNLDKGMCGNTFYATNSSIDLKTKDADFASACSEIIDICLMLSFLNARCVTPSGTTAQSAIKFMQLGDDFIRARAIDGFDALTVPSMTGLFSAWLTASYAPYRQRHLRLQLSHWLSGLTCFSLEDIYLSVGVQMDVIKQQERAVTGKGGLTYFQGMTSASTRYALNPLGKDYKNMRNDIVHEGVLSGAKFAGKSKAQCADVVADTLNWLDRYVLSVVGLTGHVSNLPRWRGQVLLHSLPALTVR
jgi:hypothetical protein